MGVPILLIDNYRTDKRINGLTYIEMDQLNWYAENELEIRATDAVNELIENAAHQNCIFLLESLRYILLYVCILNIYVRKVF